MTTRAEARAHLFAFLHDAALLAPDAAAEAEQFARAALGALKSVDDEVDGYLVTLSDWVQQAFGGRMTKVDLARAMRAMIRAEARTVYIAGLEEGGVPEEDMDEEDEQAIDDWIAGQLPHVAGFAADAVAAGSDEALREQIGRRVDEWVASFRALGTQGVMSARRNEMGTWEYDPDKEHCQSGNGKMGCEELNGQRHRLSWFTRNGYIPQEPGSDALACGGWECGCKIKNDKGKQLVP